MKLLKILSNLFICGILAIGMTPFVGMEIALGFVSVLFVLSFIPKGDNYTFANEVLITIFTSDIQKNIFPNNSFYKNSKLDSGVDINAKTVEIPQAGSKPTVVKNPTVFPLPIGTRTDDKETYDVDLFATLPIRVEDVNEATLSYSKRQDILDDHIMELNTQIADNMNFIWNPSIAANIIRTTGTVAASGIPTGATGDRKAVVKNDFINAMNLMNNQDVPQEGRKVVLPANMYADLVKIEEFVSAEKIGRANLTDGAIGRILGFDIFVRSQTTLFDDSPTPVKQPVGSAVQADWNQAALFWHPQFVRRAEGTVKVYMEMEKPTLLGSVMNGAVRNGGLISRTDQRGVVALVQETL